MYKNLLFIIGLFVTCHLAQANNCKTQDEHINKNQTLGWEQHEILKLNLDWSSTIGSSHPDDPVDRVIIYSMANTDKLNLVVYIRCGNNKIKEVASNDTIINNSRPPEFDGYSRFVVYRGQNNTSFLIKERLQISHNWSDKGQTLTFSYDRNKKLITVSNFSYSESAISCGGSFNPELQKSYSYDLGSFINYQTVKSAGKCVRVDDLFYGTIITKKMPLCFNGHQDKWKKSLNNITSLNAYFAPALEKIEKLEAEELKKEPEHRSAVNLFPCD